MGKESTGETLLNTPYFIFKKLCGVILKANIKALLKFPSSAIYRRLMVDLVEVNSFPSYFVSFLFILFVRSHHLLIISLCFVDGYAHDGRHVIPAGYKE